MKVVCIRDFVISHVTRRVATSGFQGHSLLLLKAFLGLCIPILLDLEDEAVNDSMAKWTRSCSRSRSEQVGGLTMRPVCRRWERNHAVGLKWQTGRCGD